MGLTEALLRSKRLWGSNDSAATLFSPPREPNLSSKGAILTPPPFAFPRRCRRRAARLSGATTSDDLASAVWSSLSQQTRRAALIETLTASGLHLCLGQRADDCPDALPSPRPRFGRSGGRRGVGERRRCSRDRSRHSGWPRERARHLRPNCEEAPAYPPEADRAPQSARERRNRPRPRSSCRRGRSWRPPPSAQWSGQHPATRGQTL